MSKINNTKDELKKILEAIKVKQLDDTADPICNLEASIDLQDGIDESEKLLKEIKINQLDDTADLIRDLEASIDLQDGIDKSERLLKEIKVKQLDDTADSIRDLEASIDLQDGIDESEKLLKEIKVKQLDDTADSIRDLDASTDALGQCEDTFIFYPTSFFSNYFESTFANFASELEAMVDNSTIIPDADNNMGWPEVSDLLFDDFRFF